MYCSTGQNLYYELAMTYMNVDTGEEYPPEMFDEKKHEHAACLFKLDAHFQTCVQCSLAEYGPEKKPATSVH